VATPRRRAADARYILDNIARNLDIRIKRFYYYAFQGDPTFDSGPDEVLFAKCPRPHGCAQRRTVNQRAVRPELYNLYKSYTNP
jgi:hypothetical protein